MQQQTTKLLLLVFLAAFFAGQADAVTVDEKCLVEVFRFVPGAGAAGQLDASDADNLFRTPGIARFMDRDGNTKGVPFSVFRNQCRPGQYHVAEITSPAHQAEAGPQKRGSRFGSTLRVLAGVGGAVGTVLTYSNPIALAGIAGGSTGISMLGNHLSSRPPKPAKVEAVSRSPAENSPRAGQRQDFERDRTVYQSFTNQDSTDRPLPPLVVTRSSRN